ncbi:MAG: LLM class flavin-dependent oxidoreductase [Acidimicrobiia bacterium]
MSGFQFGVNLSMSAAPGADPITAALTAERLGFDFVSASDHPCGRHPTNETWTTLAWVAARTTTIRVASRVLGVPFRNPVLLAKMAETLSRLSGGRLLLGLGAGASEDEIGAMGIPSLSGGERIAALEEAVMIIRGVWASPAFSYDGTYHRACAAEIQPKPEQPIPLWLGTFGDHALAVTGRVADGWIPSLGYAPADQLGVMRDKVLAAADEAGRQPEAVACVLNVEVQIGEDRSDSADALIGRADNVVDRLLEFVNLGFNGFNFMALGPDPLDQYRRLALEVVPALRERT